VGYCRARSGAGAFFLDHTRPSADFVVTSGPHWALFGIFTRAVGFLKALIVLVTNLPWAAESHFAFTFISCFLMWAALALKTVR
jgi:hypothetical protein